MKLTEKKIKKIILEELESLLEKEETPVDNQPDEESGSENDKELLPNVEVVDKLIKARIKQPKEYSQLLQTLLKFTPETMSDSLKVSVLRQLKDLITQLLT